MAEVRFDQFSFTTGEVDPRIQSRPDWEGYYKALKFARNIQILPQGGFQRRWGTVYVDTCTVGNPAIPSQFEMCTLQYDELTTYLIIWEPLSCKIYLEDELVATVTTTYQAEDIINLRFSQVENQLVITNINFQPAQLVRSADSPNSITSVDTVNNYINVTTGYTVGDVYPVQFTTSGSLPTTSPQIYTARNYFVRAVTATSWRIFSNATDAINDVNFYTISALGSSSSVIVQNTWALSNISFINQPTYDFFGNYSGITFTPSATSGNSVTITLSAPLAQLTSANFVGGLFTGEGGVLRITSVADTSHFTGYTVTSFPSTSAIEGSLCFLGQPVWSNALGWPKYSSFFQNRLVFAGSYSLPNGVWLSVVNEARNFDDSLALDDYAISWYPAGGNINLIVAITSARSLLIHTNNGTFSTPLLNEAPVTPLNFTLTEQNKFAVKSIQPIFLDNQIIFVDTASNVINMIWDITTSSFTTNNISVMSSSLIQFPVDTASYYEPKATDGFYGMFVNGDGTLATLQTLHEQNISAWSLMNTSIGYPVDQNNNFTITPSNYIHVISSTNRCWFLVQRLIPIASAGVSISGFSSINDTLTATNHGLTIGAAELIGFTTTGSLPVTSPQINTTQAWFSYAIDANTFQIYSNFVDATNRTNPLSIISAGINSKVVPMPQSYKVFIEEVSFNVLTDAASIFNFSVGTQTITGLNYLNGSVVNVKGDGYVLQNQTVFNNQITTEYAAKYYEIGLNYISKGTPLPISIPQVMGTLYKPKHVRSLYIRYYQSIGITVLQGTIPIITMQQQVLGVPPTPEDGVFLATPMEGWNEFDVTVSSDINIVQSSPLPMTILGLSYVLEVS